MTSNLYIYWEISLIKQLGFETDFLNSKNSNILFNDLSKTSYSHLKIPNILLSESNKKLSNAEIREALISVSYTHLTLPTILLV